MLRLSRGDDLVLYAYRNRTSSVFYNKKDALVRLPQCSTQQGHYQQLILRITVQ